MFRNRYRALRIMGVDWISATLISMLNSLTKTLDGTIIFMHLVIEYDPEEVEQEWKERNVFF